MKNFLLPALLLLTSGVVLFLMQGTDTATRAEFERWLKYT